MTIGHSDDAFSDSVCDLLSIPVADRPAPAPDRQLHIVLVAPPYFDVPPSGYGGVEAVVASLADELVARGRRVTLLGAGRAGTKARFIRVWDEPQSAKLGEPYPEIVHAMKVWRIIERLHREDPIDIVHDHTFAGPLNAAGYRMLGIPAIATVHGPVDAEMCDYYRAFDRNMKLVAISDRQRELAPDLNWIGRVHNAINPEEWPFHTEKMDYALFLGRYAPYKGPDVALRAAHAAGIRLILAGKCNEPAEKAYFAEHVEPLLTATDDVFGEADAIAKRQLLAGAKCMLFPISWDEPFGIVMIEAMVCGTPVVALRGGAVAEVIEHGVTGFICDHPDELPDAIARVGEIDPHACRRRVEELFATDRFAAGYDAVYRQAVLTGIDSGRSIGRHRRATMVPSLSRKSGGTVRSAW
ncbi:glycosyltransferase family 4 protein [Nocardia sp. NPDC051030]|uniref:glycosyltransferase family 4 protein n=1 Tax=Nocardia sp. NPDC051030 TaxID=3155162 RepID=UPI0034485ACE